MEVVQGSLVEDEIKSVVKQVLEGLIYLHTNGYLHVSFLPLEHYQPS